MAPVLGLLAALRADVGADPDAVRLFAAAEAHTGDADRLAMSAPLLDVDAELSALRERLGDEAFDEAWSEGLSLSREEAVAFAQRGRGPRQRPQAGWDSLTPTERQVVALVAEGLTNPQIAERLFISRRTVSTHLSHVFAKLAISSRTELAAQATKRAL
jgi:DNA-binding CsgD family transcriptional regulator